MGGCGEVLSLFIFSLCMNYTSCETFRFGDRFRGKIIILKLSISSMFGLVLLMKIKFAQKHCGAEPCDAVLIPWRVVSSDLV